VGKTPDAKGRTRDAGSDTGHGGFRPDFLVSAPENEGMTTTSDTTVALRIRAIDPDVLSQLRRRDDAGNPPRLMTDEAGGSPLRCCLRLSRAGERVAFVAYAPLCRWARETGADPGPYDEVGPIFIHPAPCQGPDSPGFPPALTGSPRVFRAYSADGRILAGRLAGPAETQDAASAEAILAEVFADPAVAVVHARALDFGCFTFEVRRG
jgi:Protein of unknown function (DUF1203)